MIPADDLESLALLYHLNSEPRATEEPEAAPPGDLALQARLRDATIVGLPSPPDGPRLLELVRRRRSCRSYGPGAMPLADLASILEGTYGLVAAAQVTDLPGFIARAVPSAGGLYPLEVYVAAASVDGIAAGLYHYDPAARGLERLRPGDVLGELAGLLLHQECVQGASAVLILSAIFRRTLARYGPRGYRYILLEAGHAAQNACLIATELGLGSLCLGGFIDSRLNRFLGLDGRSEAALYGVAVGLPAD